MAESVGLDVYFYDIENKLPLGNATQVRHLSELLNMCDIVTAFTRARNAINKNMIGHEELLRMKPGALFLLMPLVELWLIFRH